MYERKPDGQETVQEERKTLIARGVVGIEGEYDKGKKQQLSKLVVEGTEPYCL